MRVGPGSVAPATAVAVAPPTGTRGVARQSTLSGSVATLALGAGLLLDVAAAAAFGAGRDTDAFVAAARLPLAGTAVLLLLGNQVLVPTFATWAVTLEARRMRRLVTGTLLAAVGIGAALALALGALGPLLARVLAPGFDAEQTALTASLLWVMVWTLPLAAGCEVLRSWFNARAQVVVPAAMTVVMNLVAAGLVLTWPGDVRVLPLAYVVGSACQLLLVLAWAVVRGFRVARPRWRDPELVALPRLLARPSTAAGLNPLARVAETAIASFLAPGSATVLHYGNRLVSAVGGTVLFRSVMVAVLPRLTRAQVAGRRDEAAALATLGLRLMVAVSLPLTALTVVLAVPGVELLFGLGRFGESDARLLGLCVVVLALSFPASAVQRALLAPYYAARDTRVPLRNAVVGVAVDLALLPVAVLPLLGTGYEVLGVAAAFVAGNVANVVHAHHCLVRSELPRPRLDAAALRGSVLGALAVAAAAGAAWALGGGLAPLLPGSALRLVVAGSAGVVVLVLTVVVQRRASSGGRHRRTGGAGS